MNPIYPGLCRGKWIKQKVAQGFCVVRGILYLFATSVMMIYLIQLLQSVSTSLMVAAKESMQVYDIRGSETGLRVKPMNNKSIIETCARRYDSFYLYDENSIRSSLSALKANFPGIEFLYSIKCNPNPHVLRCVFVHGLVAAAASLGEVIMADHAGLGQDQIFYSAPGKTVKEIEGAMTKATLIADSLEEIERIRHVAESAGRTVKIGLRINPDFTFTKEYGQASKFGIDEEQALRFLKEHDGKNIRVSGIHVHLKSQELHTDALASYYEKLLRLSERFSHVCGGLDYVNMGSGIGVPYTETDEPPDLSYLGSFVRKRSTVSGKSTLKQDG